MGISQPVQMPISLAGGNKRDTRSQFAALCYKVKDGKTRVLLITSRGTGRWVVPKGWPEDGLTPSQCAEKEAMEEAGVTGKAYDRCLGVFSYEKYIDETEGWPCMAMLYPVHTKKLLKDFPEKDQRKRKWFTQKEAAQRVDEPELAKLIKTFDPKLLKTG